jgi:hypothetical protein
MTRDDIIRMAREADLHCHMKLTEHGLEIEDLEHFAELVAASERERMKYDGIHTCQNECQRPACVAMRKAVQREREACAKVVEEYPHWIGLTAKAEISNAIRARGER